MYKLNTPVAFIIFNRPDTTERVFAEIAKAKPTRLFVVADGARTEKAGEAEKVAATRAIIDRNDQRIGMISGDNFQFGNRRNDDSYYFSKYVHIWGWATWRDRWQSSYDVDLKKWPAIRDGGWLEDILGNKKEVTNWKDIFERTYKCEIDSWVFANWLEGRINVMPNVNLISNIGFGAGKSILKALFFTGRAW